MAEDNFLIYTFSNIDLSLLFSLQLAISIVTKLGQGADSSTLLVICSLETNAHEQKINQYTSICFSPSLISSLFSHLYSSLSLSTQLSHSSPLHLIWTFFLLVSNLTKMVYWFSYVYMCFFVHDRYLMSKYKWQNIMSDGPQCSKMHNYSFGIMFCNSVTDSLLISYFCSSGYNRCMLQLDQIPRDVMFFN